MDYEPLDNLLVIQLSEESKEKKSESGFLFQTPKWAKPQNIGKILARGPLVSSLAVDEYVLINPYAVIDTDDKLIKLVREKDVLCRIKTKAQ